MKRRQFLGCVGAGAAALACGSGGSSRPEQARLARPSFYWGIGIENTWMVQTDPLRDGGRRLLDEYLQTQHYVKWRQDLDLVAELGVNALRYSVPWYLAEPAPGEYDWSWIDGPIQYLVEELGIVPIMDLVHYGTPSWMPDGLLDPRYVEAVAQYTEAIALHFRGLVNHYTPHNEPQLNAALTGLAGTWPPYRASAAYWMHLGLQLAQGIVRQTQALRATLPDAVIISADTGVPGVIDSLFREGTPEAARQAARATATAFPTSLAYGLGDPLFREMLIQHGVSETVLAWLSDNAEAPDVVGCNVYPDSVAIASGYEDFTRRGEIPLPAAAQAAAEFVLQAVRITHEYYGLPVYVSETSAGLTPDAKLAYMNAVGEGLGKLRAEGLPIVGLNWWPLFDAVQWDYREKATKPLQDFIRPGGWNNGLYSLASEAGGELRRVETPAVAAYRELVRRG